MATGHDAFFRDELLDRRQRLETALPRVRDPEPLRLLLREVDSALERIEKGAYGLCDTCHEPVESERLLADPLVRYCLDHLTRDQQRALQQDLDLTSRIQGELLPDRRLDCAGWEAAYHYEPLGPVSGDYCDLIRLEDGAAFVVVGDVSGKGVAASMLMAHLHATIRSLVGLGLSGQELVERANRLFCESVGAGRYATLVCARARPSGEVELCNAGHCPPLLVGPGGARGLPADGVPVGLFSSARYSTTPLRLAPGETLLLYTDGVTEARDRSDGEYGVDRLGQAAARGRAGTAPELLRACLEDLAAFRAGAPRQDDVTLLALRRNA